MPKLPPQLQQTGPLVVYYKMWRTEYEGPYWATHAGKPVEFNLLEDYRTFARNHGYTGIRVKDTQQPVNI